MMNIDINRKGPKKKKRNLTLKKPSGVWMQ